MKKFFSKILIVILILGFFFTPATPKIDTQNHFSLVKNEANGQGNDAALLPNEKALFENANYDQYSQGDPDSCGLLNLDLCLVKFFEFLFFRPLAFFARLSADLLDFFISFSIDSDSYKGKTFVDLGWAVVRDIANLFFIMAMLYIAGKTVLGLNGSNNKRMISMIIMMALLINFSLFFTKVVIDASNILANVFYSNIENVDQNGTKNVENPGGGGRSITVGIVKQFNPQQLFTKYGISQTQNTGEYFMVTLIGIIIMIYMIKTFLSLTFVFLGRLITLWILMIFSPIAFASNALPGVKVPYGWSEWFSELMNNAFLAPIFIFFLYLIVSFGDLAGKVIAIDSSGGKEAEFMSILIPFLITIVLISKAKTMAMERSSELGKGMASWGGILGTAALGLATGGAAMLGRKAIGGTLARASRGETLSQRVAINNTAGLNKFQIAMGKIGSKIGMSRAFGDNIRSMRTGNIDTGLGGYINKKQQKIHDINHGKHELDTAMKNAHLEGREMNSLSAIEKQTLMKEFTKIKKTEIETDIKEGKVTGVDSRSEYEKKNRKTITNNMLSSTNIAKSVSDGDAKEIIDPKTNIGTGKYELTKQGEQNRESELNTGYTKILQQNTERVAKSKFDHAEKEAGTKISFLEKTASKSTSSNYDIRDFKPELKGLNWKGAASLLLLTSIANSLRSGLKKAEVDPGKGTGNITKDLTATITTAIANLGKSMKVDMGAGGHGGGGHDDHKKDDHGGGGHGH